MLAAKRLIDAGVFAVFAEHDHSVTQFKPPLIVSESEVDEIAAAVARRAGVSGGAPELSDAELARLEELVASRLASGRTDEPARARLRRDLPGARLAARAPRFACKRLPPFPTRASASTPTGRRWTTTSTRSPPLGCGSSRRELRAVERRRRRRRRLRGPAGPAAGGPRPDGPAARGPGARDIRSSRPSSGPRPPRSAPRSGSTRSSPTGPGTGGDSPTSTSRPR